jgi:hypothetical protein
LEDRICFKANYLSNEKIEEAWKECWRFWDEVYFKRAITGYGLSRAILEDDEWCWQYSISVYGTDEDITFLFDSKENVLAFHEVFSNYMSTQKV